MRVRDWLLIVACVLVGIWLALILWAEYTYAEGEDVYRVTAYCLRGRTASGRYVHYGSVAAGRQIPIGTQLYVPGYGYGVVEDRGGAIYGNRLDIWMPNCRQAMVWGVRYVSVEMF